MIRLEFRLQVQCYRNNRAQIREYSDKVFGQTNEQIGAEEWAAKPGQGCDGQRMARCRLEIQNNNRG